MKIKLYGTHHLMEEKEIVAVLKGYMPDVVCIELDELRLKKLQGEEIDQSYLKEISWFSRYIITKINKKSSNIAKDSEQQYGNDMISALQYCGEKKIPVKLIDMGVKEIAKGFDKLNWGEKVLMWMGVGFGSTSLEQVNNLTEEKVQANMEELKRKLPNLYNHVVVARDKFMANKISEVLLIKKYERVLVFVGQGHVKGIKAFLHEKGINSE